MGKCEAATEGDSGSVGRRNSTKATEGARGSVDPGGSAAARLPGGSSDYHSASGSVVRAASTKAEAAGGCCWHRASERHRGASCKGGGGRGTEQTAARWLLLHGCGAEAAAGRSTKAVSRRSCAQAYLHALYTTPEAYLPEAELAGLAPVRAFLGGGRAWEASTGGGGQAGVAGVGQ